MACAWGGSSAGVGDFIEGENMGWWEFGYPMNDLRQIITSITSFFDL